MAAGLCVCVCAAVRVCVLLAWQQARVCMCVCVCFLSVSPLCLGSCSDTASLKLCSHAYWIHSVCVCVSICVCLCTAVQRLPLCNVFLESRCRSGGARVKPRPQRGQLSGSLPVAVTESEKTVFFCQLFCPVHPHMQRRSAASSFLH